MLKGIENGWRCLPEMETNNLERMSKIERMIQETQAFKLVSREFQKHDTIVKINT